MPHDCGRVMPSFIFFFLSFGRIREAKSDQTLLSNVNACCISTLAADIGVIVSHFHHWGFAGFSIKGGE